MTTDPYKDEFSSRIQIVSLTNVSLFNFTEVLPLGFNVSDGGGACQYSDGYKIYLTWTSLSNNSGMQYSARPPTVSPELYELGPSFVEYGPARFDEGRAWFMAVDPASDAKAPRTCTGDWIGCDGTFVDGGTEAQADGPDLSMQLYNFSLSVPDNAVIDGIYVFHDSRDPDATDSVNVSLSWDGGTSWTAQKGRWLTATETTYTEGGARDNWGRDWNATVLNSNTSFRGRLIAAGSTNEWFVDYVRVQVYYTVPEIYRAFPGPIGRNDPIYIGVEKYNSSATSTINVTRVDINASPNIGSNDFFTSVTSGSGYPADPTIVTSPTCGNNDCILRFSGSWNITPGNAMAFYAQVTPK